MMRIAVAVLNVLTIEQWLLLWGSNSPFFFKGSSYMACSKNLGLQKRMPTEGI